MVFNSTFNNISVISWRQVLLVDETEENHNMSQVIDKIYHIMLHRQQPAINGVQTHNFSGYKHWLHVGSCKSNYLKITITTAPLCQAMFKQNIIITWKQSFLWISYFQGAELLSDIILKIELDQYFMVNNIYAKVRKMYVGAK
jgi:hypothetical protein